MQKGFVPILIVIIITALVGGYLLYQNQNQSKPAFPSQSESTKFPTKEVPIYNCGGFMGTQCPSGYKCKILGGDAGTCVSNKLTDSEEVSNNTIIYKSVTVQELSIHLENYLNQNVQVSGKLVSQGSINDLKFYLVDGLDKITVRPWRPLEIATPPGDVSAGQPSTMLDFTDHFLILKGQIKKDSDELYFSIQNAEESSVLD